MLTVVCFTGCGGDTPTNPEEPSTEDPTEKPVPEEPTPPQETIPNPGLSFTSVTLPNEGDTFACKIYGLNDDEWNA